MEAESLCRAVDSRPPVQHGAGVQARGSGGGPVCVWTAAVRGSWLHQMARAHMRTQGHWDMGSAAARPGSFESCLPLFFST